MRSTRAAAIAAAVVLLAGCSEGSTPDDQDNAAGGTKQLGNLTGAQMCELVDPSTIEKEFGVTLATPFSPPVSGDSADNEPATDSCLYPDADDNKATTDFFTLTTIVTAAKDGTSAKESLEKHFRAYDGGELVDYQPIDGLGAGAGFADRDSDVGPSRDHIFTVLDVGGALLEVQVDVTPKGTPDQLKPIATRLLDGLEAAL